MVALVACETAPVGGDASRPDASPLATDAPRSDALADAAGATFLAARGAPRLVDDCPDAPLLAWNGMGWGLTWRSPPCAPHVREIAVDGTPLASLPIPDLPPAAGVSFPAATVVDTFAYAHGAYAIDASTCSVESCGPPYLGALARDGAPLSWVPSGGVLAAAGSVGDVWLTLEKGPTTDTPPLGGFFVVTRDAALHEVARTLAPYPDTTQMLSSYGLLAPGPHAILASWSRPDGASAYALLGPDGAPIGDAFEDGAARAIAPWGEDFLAVEVEPTGPGVTTIDLVVIDGGGAGVRTRTTASPGGASHVAFLPDRGLVGLCWVTQVSGPSGALEQAAAVQLVDVAAGAILGLPYVIEGVRSSDIDCGTDGASITVAFGDGATGTFVQQLDVLR